jgi:hypothetical protein
MKKSAKPLLSTRARIPGPKGSLGLCWGAAAIAAEIGVTQRQAFYLLQRAQLPAMKIGNRWCVSRESLKLHFAGASSRGGSSGSDIT